MRCLSVLGILGLGLLVAAAEGAPNRTALANKGSNKPANKGTGTKKHHGFHGVVVRVHHKDNDGKGRRFRVKHNIHKKDRAGDVIDGNLDKVFHVTDATTFERVDVYGHGKKAKRVVTATTFAHLHKGQHVNVHHNGHVATDVKIIHHHKKK